jgi:serine/threonine protein kinase
MIIDLLNHSLEDLFQLWYPFKLSSNKKFTVPTMINIGIQLITRLEQIHRKGFVHRDIKANNFMIGKGEKAKTVYVIDFGLAKRYKDIKTNQHIAEKGGKSLVGTARYASIASHNGF